MKPSARLPIYDLPEMRERNAALWAAAACVFREAGIADVPDRLDDSDGPELFTQVCGLPLTTTQRGRYALLGTPAYDVAGCSGTSHRSFIVVGCNAPYDRPAGLRGRRFAVNEAGSNTGMNLARRSFAALAGGAPFFSRIVQTGSHAASLESVAEHRADAAAIDCVTYAFLAEFRPALTARTRIIAQTDSTPAIPFVTAAGGDHGRLTALRDALARLSSEACFAPILRALHIGAIRLLDDADYAIIGEYADEAARAGYPVLC